MDNKRIVPWALALVFAVLASSEVLHAGGGQKGSPTSNIAPPVPPKPAAPTKWQYRTDVGASDTLANFNAMMQKITYWGGVGWEVAAIVPFQTKATNNGEDDVSMIIYKKPL